MKLRPAVSTAVIAAICGCSFASESAAPRHRPDPVGFRAPAPIDSGLGVPTQRLNAPLGPWTLGAPAGSLEIDAYLVAADRREAVDNTRSKPDAGEGRPVIVPEPSTFALMLAGVSVVIFLGARRRRF